MKEKVISSVLSAALIALLSAAISTYFEVRMLRHDVNELRQDLDKLYGATNDHVQDPDGAKARRMSAGRR